MAEERIQKILARAGFGSRRDCEEYIRAGRITVNGVKVELGAKADPSHDQIYLDHKLVQVPKELIYIALHKPRLVLSAINQDDPRKNVLNYVPFEGHLFPVGRLDYDSEGLLLLTNDGDFANKLAHPRYDHEKEYIVQIGSRPDESQINTWRRGIVLEDGYRTAPARVEVIETQPKSATLRVILKEGRKRQIRECGERIGLPVQRIKRVRIGTILLGNLKPGEWRQLTRQEIASMQKALSTDGTKRYSGKKYTHPVTDAGRSDRNSVAVWRGRKKTNETNSPGSNSKSTVGRKPAENDEVQAKPLRKTKPFEGIHSGSSKPENSKRPGRPRNYVRSKKSG